MAYGLNLAGYWPHCIGRIKFLLKKILYSMSSVASAKSATATTPAKVALITGGHIYSAFLMILLIVIFQELLFSLGFSQLRPMNCPLSLFLFLSCSFFSFVTN